MTMKWLTASKMIAVGMKDDGLAIMDLNFDRKRITKYASFLLKETIKDVVELAMNRILVMTQ